MTGRSDEVTEEDNRFMLQVCIAAGALISVVCCLWVDLVLLVLGTVPFDQAGSSPLECIGVFLLIGPLGGALIGSMIPFARSMISFIFIGFVASVTLFSSFIFLIVPTDEWIPALLVVAFVGLLSGGGRGYAFWRVRDQESRTSSSPSD